MKERRLRFGAFELRVREAVWPWERMRGLLGVASLPDHEGLLLPRCRHVHTVGMRMALDLVFLAADLRILAIQAHVPPGRWCCAGPRDTWATLELAAGVAERLGLRPGALDKRPSNA